MVFAFGTSCPHRAGGIKAFSSSAAKSRLCHYFVKTYPLYAGHFESQTSATLQLSLTQTRSNPIRVDGRVFSRAKRSACGELLFVHGTLSEIWVHIRQRRARPGSVPASLARAHSSPIQHVGNQELGAQISAISVLSLPTWEALGREEGSLTKPGLNKGF